MEAVITKSSDSFRVFRFHYLAELIKIYQSQKHFMEQRLQNYAFSVERRCLECSKSFWSLKGKCDDCGGAVSKPKDVPFVPCNPKK